MSGFQTVQQHMAAELSKERVGSISPTNTTGRGPIPSGDVRNYIENGYGGQYASKRYTQVAVPLTHGHKSRLSADAIEFEPSTKVLSPIAALNVGSTKDDENDGPLIVSSPTHVTKSTSTPTAATSPQIQRPREYYTTDMGTGVPNEGGHFVQVDGILEPDVDQGVKELIDNCGYAPKQIWSSKIVRHENSPCATYMACFSDVRDASAAHDQVKAVNPGLQVAFINQPAFAAAMASGGKIVQTSFFDGQVAFEAHGPASHLDFAASDQQVERLAATFGPIHAFNYVDVGNNKAVWRVEYKSLADAHDAMERHTTDSPWVAPNMDWWVTTKQFTAGAHDSSARSPSPARANIQYSPSGRTAWSVDHNGTQTLREPRTFVPQVNDSYHDQALVNYTPTRDSRWQSAPSGWSSSVMTPASAVRNNSFPLTTTRGGRRPSADHAMITPQTVIPAKIDAGTDVRTTLMLRNIPNRMTCWELKNILDRSSKGRYDFFYLRVDFKKNTNVGYGFVNFCEPADIIAFINDILEKPWVPGSLRMAEVSYATIQGLDCLIEKFRNSSIMDEVNDYRPKMWYTDASAPAPEFIGQECSFPTPNNMSKKQRSHDNASTLGLFPPRSANNGRDRQRRSQFDRGTPAQLQEEAFYHQASPTATQYNYASPSNMAVAPPPSYPITYGMGIPNLPQHAAGFQQIQPYGAQHQYSIQHHDNNGYWQPPLQYPQQQPNSNVQYGGWAPGSLSAHQIGGPVGGYGSPMNAFQAAAYHPSMAVGPAQVPRSHGMPHGAAQGFVNGRHTYGHLPNGSF